MWKNVASQKLPNFLFIPLHKNGHNSGSSWANWKISLPKHIYYSRAICWYPQITRGHVSRAWKRVSKFLNFDMKKLKKPDFFDLTVNEVFKYTLLAFRKHMSLLRRNFLHCLSSVGKYGTAFAADMKGSIIWSNQKPLHLPNFMLECTMHAVQK